ncbi:TIR domain-containing protein [Tolypothrix sp. VBCCA 56010]|uniref:TIR domain-containing protein n=1 Tax=Tolypothrix sp. VBCCA 56010 TaxID=3137731 RepID=UPI003D7CAFA6
MTRYAFFSFHFQRDILKIGQIRNTWLIQSRDREAQPFLDKAEWESIKRRGNQAIQNWIDSQMKGTSVTVVLIGAETYQRPWVQYEIQQSHKLGKGMLGIDMYGMKDLNGNYDSQGINPFSQYTFTNSKGTIITYPVYSWAYNDGRNNIGTWIEQAAKAAGR